MRPHRRQPTRLLHPWDSPGKNTGVGCHVLLQGIFPTPRSNPGLPHCTQKLLSLAQPERRRLAGRALLSVTGDLTRARSGAGERGTEGAAGGLGPLESVKRTGWFYLGVLPGGTDGARLLWRCGSAGARTRCNILCKWRGISLLQWSSLFRFYFASVLIKKR